MFADYSLIAPLHPTKSQALYTGAMVTPKSSRGGGFRGVHFSMYLHSTVTGCLFAIFDGIIIIDTLYHTHVLALPIRGQREGGLISV